MVLTLIFITDKNIAVGDSQLQTYGLTSISRMVSTDGLSW